MTHTTMTDDDLRILHFYSDRDDPSHRSTYSEVLAWDLARWEEEGPYFWCLFPTDQASPFDRRAPVLDEEGVEVFREQEWLRRRLLVAFDAFLRFLGLRREPWAIETRADWRERSDIWLVAGDHNLARITRVITSLRLLGLETEASRFVKALESIARTPRGSANIDDGTLQLWHRAAGER